MENLEPAIIIKTTNERNDKLMNIHQEIDIDKQRKLKLSCNDTMILFNVSESSIPKKRI